MICAGVYVGAAFGGPPDILRYCKDRHRRPLRMSRQNVGAHSVRPWITMIYAVVYVGEPALGLPSVRTKLSGGRGRPPLQMVRQNVGADIIRPCFGLLVFLLFHLIHFHSCLDPIPTSYQILYNNYCSLFLNHIQ